MQNTHRIHRLWTAALLAATLGACATHPGSAGHQRAEHHYAFGKPNPGVTVAPVVAAARQPQRGPENLAHVVYFDYDDYAIRASERALVESHAQWLRNHPERSVVLHGHTDARGGAEYNLALGQRRAESVGQALQLLGVNPARIEAASYGKERLADSGASDAAHQHNRRVEFDYR